MESGWTASTCRRCCVASPREGRKFAYGGYANWHYARTHEWAYVANNFGTGRRLYDLERDPKEEDNIARRHRKRLDVLDAAIRRRAGRRANSRLSLTARRGTRENHRRAEDSP